MKDFRIKYHQQPAYIKYGLRVGPNAFTSIKNQAFRKGSFSSPMFHLRRVLFIVSKHWNGLTTKEKQIVQSARNFKKQ